MADYTEVRVRELTDYGSWPWRYVVEGLTKERVVKRWPWSRKATVAVAPEWERLRHGVRGLKACDECDAEVLADHYRNLLATSSDKEGGE